jgi:hypothetical protein
MAAGTYLLHVLRLRGRRIPAVVQDEDVWAGETLTHLVKELLLLDKGQGLSGGSAEPAEAPPTTCPTGTGQMQRSVTVCISVDSELATSTNTSASRQNLSIQLSSSVVTSIPGLEITGKSTWSGTKTSSSLSVVNRNL